MTPSLFGFGSAKDDAPVEMDRQRVERQGAALAVIVGEEDPDPGPAVLATLLGSGHAIGVIGRWCRLALARGGFAVSHNTLRWLMVDVLKDASPESAGDERPVLPYTGAQRMD